MRIRDDYVFGVSTAALASTDTILSAEALARLSVVTTPDIAAITLHNSTTGVYEIVHITAHTAAATTATILRGQEGSTAQAWPPGTTWLHGATSLDLEELAPKAAPALTGAATLDGQAIVKTNDSRLSDSRAPSGAASGSLAGTYPGPSLAAGAVNSAEINAAIKDAAATTASLRTLGTGALQAAAGDDARLSDARTPLAHNHVKANITDFSHAHLIADLPTDATVPAALGTAAAGTAATVARRDHVHAMPTAAAVGAAAASHNHDTADLTGGTLADARIPSRLQEYRSGNVTSNDWNLCSTTGWYASDTAANSPAAGQWMIGWVMAHNSDWVTQQIWRMTLGGYQSGVTPEGWRRVKQGGTWGAWHRVMDALPELDARYARATGGGREVFGYWGAVTGTVTIDLNFYSAAEMQANGNITIALANVPIGASGTASASTVTVLVYGGGTGFTITPPVGTRMMGGAMPTTTAGKFIALTFFNLGHTSWTLCSAVKEV